MNTEAKIVRVFNIAIAVGVAVWLFKGCDKQRRDHDVEMKGRGMLEAKGFRGDLPENAGRDYYYMKEDPSYKEADYQQFFARLRAYQRGERGKEDE